MTDYNFEGDIAGITVHQLEYIKKVLIKNGFENAKAVFAPVGMAGDNYVANVKRITIESEDSTMNMIAKIAPSNEVLRKTMNTSVMFQNEHVVYTELLPKFIELQKQADFPEDDIIKFPICYGSFTESPNEVILLEDLTTSNYKMLDRLKPLSDACVNTVLKTFAIFHSLSYACKAKEPETYEYFNSRLQDVWAIMAENKEVAVYFEQMEENILSVLENEDHKGIVRRKLIDAMKVGAKLKKADAGSKCSVLIHGDAWTNNMMFRTNEDETNIELIMIDYQGVRDNNPVSDILHMIFNCTDYEARLKHFYEWIYYYHSELDKALSNFGLKANYVYPRDKLDADMKRYGKLYFGIALLVSSSLMLSPEEAAKVKEAMEKYTDNIFEVTDELKMSDLEVETMLRVKDRIVGLINSFNEFGLL